MAESGRGTIGDDILENWAILGSGGFGLVLKATHKLLGIGVAIKLLNCDDSSGTSYAALCREAGHMEAADQQFVPRVYGMYRGRPPIIMGSNEMQGIVMELMEGGCLQSFLLTKSHKPPPWPLAFRLAHQVALAMDFLHCKKNLVHMDLKPANILLDADLNAKIADFGLSTMSNSVRSTNHTNKGGTLFYMPPEAFGETYRRVRSYDVYSYGILLWTILTGESPYPGMGQTLLMYHIPRGQRPDLRKIDVQKAAGLEELVELMQRCWDSEPNKRPLFAECVEVTRGVFSRHEEGISAACDLLNPPPPVPAPPGAPAPSTRRRRRSPPPPAFPPLPPVPAPAGAPAPSTSRWPPPAPPVPAPPGAPAPSTRRWPPPPPPVPAPAGAPAPSTSRWTPPAPPVPAPPGAPAPSTRRWPPPVPAPPGAPAPSTRRWPPPPPPVPAPAPSTRRRSPPPPAFPPPPPVPPPPPAPGSTNRETFLKHSSPLSLDPNTANVNLLLSENNRKNTLESCTICSKPIMERILRAIGKAYHPHCFTCVVCQRCQDGIPFIVDAANHIHCIEDFHKKFAPRCCVCSEPIMPAPGQEETVRIVALDRDFHVQCYRCEDCGSLLSEGDNQGWLSLDRHVLCKNCITSRTQALSAKVTTDL